MAVFTRTKTWVSNEVLTASDLNAEFNNLLNNTIPASIEDYSADVATMQSATDPGGVGTESLATTLAGEIQRLRYKIKQIMNGAQWYSTPVGSLSTGGISTSALADSSVTAVKIASDAVTTVKILDANVTTAKIANSNVTTDKIADSNVTTAKIADSNVTTGKVANGAITPAKRSTAVYNESFFTSVTTSATGTISFTGNGRPVLICLSKLATTSSAVPWSSSTAGASLYLYKNGSNYRTIATDSASSNQAYLDSFTTLDSAGYSGSLTYDLRTSAGTFTSNTGTVYLTAIEL